ncbi:hypothetical protein Agub_g10494, partial [Astrephomene gubernaculifera]
LVLRFSSERFAAQLERWDRGGEQAPPAASSPSSTSTPSNSRPELRIPLASEVDVPSARAAIRFAYTGQVQAGSVREVLEVRRQAAYLQIEGCAEACDEVLRGMMAAAASQGDGDGGGGAGAPPGVRPAALEFYTHGALWPDPAVDKHPSFIAVIAAAKQQVVSYFGNTLRVLNTPSLRQQLLDLPAVAVEALLESDSFGTDSESSVLLMLATWMQANYGKTDAGTRKRLGRQVRLVQLSKPYLSYVLPLLAADYEVSPNTPAGWFPVTVSEAAFIASFAGASEKEQRSLLDDAELLSKSNIHSAAYSTAPRTQCVPEDGIGFAAHIPQRELEEELAGLQPGGMALLLWTMEQQQFMFAQGLMCVVSIGWCHGGLSADVWMYCFQPAAYITLSPRRFSDHAVPVLVSIGRRLAINRWHNGTRADSIVLRGGKEEPVHMKRGWGHRLVLPLRRPKRGAEAGRGGGGGGSLGAGGNRQALAAWEEYLHEGKITCSLTLLPT